MFFLTDTLLMRFCSAEEIIKKYLLRFFKDYLHLTINLSTGYTKVFTTSCNHLESNSDSLLFWRWNGFFTFRSSSNLNPLINSSHIKKEEQARKKAEKGQKRIKSISDSNQQHPNWKEFVFIFSPTFYTNLNDQYAVHKLTLKVNT